MAGEKRRAVARKKSGARVVKPEHNHRPDEAAGSVLPEHQTVRGCPPPAHSASRDTTDRAGASFDKEKVGLLAEWECLADDVLKIGTQPLRDGLFREADSVGRMNDWLLKIESLRIRLNKLSNRTLDL